MVSALKVALSSEEIQVIYELAEKLTGSIQSGNRRKSVLVQNVMRRMQLLEIRSLPQYLSVANRSVEEFAHLISALTIHTTSWFREVDHFAAIEAELLGNAGSQRKIRVLSVACSTGKEVYSLALHFELLKENFPSFDYEIIGIDIDPVSISEAQRAIYRVDELSKIPRQYHRHILVGKDRTKGLFTFSKTIRDRCSFQASDLRDVRGTFLRPGFLPFDLIVCRNVLIYFSEQAVQKIIADLASLLAPQAILCLGHSEVIDGSAHGLTGLQHALYRKNNRSSQPQREASVRQREALVVDDSPTARTVMTALLREAGFSTSSVGSAAEATAFLRNSTVDFCTLDLNMPGMDGTTWLKSQRALGWRVPVVIVSDCSINDAPVVLGALETGAQDYIEKQDIHKNRQDVIDRIKAIGGRAFPKPDQSASIVMKHQKCSPATPDLIVIGASTGGTEAVIKLLRRMPSSTPPVMVVQHITPHFAEAFAERIAETSTLILGKSENNTELMPGHVYMALGDYHISVRKQGAKLVFYRSYDGPVNRHRPSVDFLFQSAVNPGTKVAAILLTGMGQDGARGLLSLKNIGACTMAQNEESSVVFGMPKEAIRLGAATFIGNIDEIRAELERITGSGILMRKNAVGM